MRTYARRATTGALAFHPECPVCRDERLAGTLPADALVGRRTQALFAAGVLALSSATPTAALAARARPGAGGLGGAGPGRRDRSRGRSRLRPGRRVDRPAVRRRPDTRRRRSPPSPTTTKPARSSRSRRRTRTRPSPTPATGRALRPPSEQQAPPTAETTQPASAHATGDARAGRTAASGRRAGHDAGRRRSPRPMQAAHARERHARRGHAEATPTPGRRPCRRPRPRRNPSPSRATRAKRRRSTSRRNRPPHPRSAPLRTAGPRGPATARTSSCAGESLWSIASDVLGDDASVAQIAREVNRLWELNSDRIGTGDPDLLMVGTRLTLR